MVVMEYFWRVAGIGGVAKLGLTEVNILYTRYDIQHDLFLDIRQGR